MTLDAANEDEIPVLETVEEEDPDAMSGFEEIIATEWPDPAPPGEISIEATEETREAKPDAEATGP